MNNRLKITMVFFAIIGPNAPLLSMEQQPESMEIASTAVSLKKPIEALCEFAQNAPFAINRIVNEVYACLKKNPHLFKETRKQYLATDDYIEKYRTSIAKIIDDVFVKYGGIAPETKQILKEVIIEMTFVTATQSTLGMIDMPASQTKDPNIRFLGQLSCMTACNCNKVTLKDRIVTLFPILESIKKIGKLSPTIVITSFGAGNLGHEAVLLHYATQLCPDTRFVLQAIDDGKDEKQAIYKHAQKTFNKLQFVQDDLVRLQLYRSAQEYYQTCQQNPSNRFDVCLAIDLSNRFSNSDTSAATIMWIEKDSEKKDIDDYKFWMTFALDGTIGLYKYQNKPANKEVLDYLLQEVPRIQSVQQLKGSLAPFAADVLCLVNPHYEFLELIKKAHKSEHAIAWCLNEHKLKHTNAKNITYNFKSAFVAPANYQKIAGLMNQQFAKSYLSE